MNLPPSSTSPQSADCFRFTRSILIGLGLLDLVALAAVIAPPAAIAWAHSTLGLGEMPRAPVVGYLARSASLLYAVHGAFLLFMARNPAHYLPLLRFIGWLTIGHGAAIAVIDVAESMPLWWCWAEGPGFAATGILLLWSLPKRPTIDAAS